ncbi:DNA-directed RNA polymerase subunit omega (fragment) [Bacillus sp. 349Y]
MEVDHPDEFAVVADAGGESVVGGELLEPGGDDGVAVDVG